MFNLDMFESGRFGSFAQIPAENVPLVRQGGDVDPGAVRSTAWIGADSLRVNEISEGGNTQADMPDWMAGSIGALHAIIEREHGVGLHEDKTSQGSHDTPETSFQVSMENVADFQGRVLYGTHRVDSHKLYLYTDDTVRGIGSSFNTNDEFGYYQTKDMLIDHHHTIYTNFVLTGSDDIHVTGHTGYHKINNHLNFNHIDGWKDQSKPVVFSYYGNTGNNTFDMTWGFFKINLTVGGENTVNMTGGVAREIIGGRGNDTINILGHGAAAESIDLRNGGNNSIYAEGWADIIGGRGNDTIESRPSFNNGNGIRADLSAGGDNIITLRGAASSVTLGAGNDTIFVNNEWNNGGHPGNWTSATIDLSLGGTNTVEITGNTRTSGPTEAHITLGKGNDTIIAHDHTVVKIFGANSTGNHTITLNGTAGRQGEVHTGKGHTDLTLNGGLYDIYLGSGSVTMTVDGRFGFSQVFDADGNLIVGRVDGQSSFAKSVHTFSAGEGINLQYSLQLGAGVDLVQFYAGSGHYQVTSSAKRDVFQFDLEMGGTEGSTFEVFDFKWGTDQIMANNGMVYDQFLLLNGSPIRFQYMGEEDGQHVFDIVAVRDFGAYDAGHVWMTVYSYDLPDLNFL